MPARRRLFSAALVWIVLAALFPATATAGQPAGVVDPNQGLTLDTPASYIYAPAALWDGTTASVYACAGERGTYGTAANAFHQVSHPDPRISRPKGPPPADAVFSSHDIIIRKTAPTLAGLANQPWERVFFPSLHESSQFDNTATCDPSVIEHGGVTYLYYGGNSHTPIGVPRGTSFGIATSQAGVAGGEFVRAGEFPHPLNPPHSLPAAYGSYEPRVNGYGIGQPSVAYDGSKWFYMLYTVAYNSNSGHVDQIVFLRSTSPLFHLDPNAPVQYAKNYNYAPQPPAPPRSPNTPPAAHDFGGRSLDLAYQPGPTRAEDRLLVISNGDRTHTDFHAFVTEWSIGANARDTAFGITKRSATNFGPGGVYFGEGIALLTTPSAQPLPSGQLTFFGATPDPVCLAGGQKNFEGVTLPTDRCHVRGPFSYWTAP